MPCTAPALLFLEVLLAAAAAAAVVVVAAAEEDFGISQIACCVTILRGVAALPRRGRVRKTVGCKKRHTVGRRGIHRLGLHVLSQPPLGGEGGTR